MNLGTVLNETEMQLSRCGIETPRTDARRMISWALGIAPCEIFKISQKRVLPCSVELSLREAVRQRCLSRPLSQIVGHRDFFDSTFFVNSNVLDPRPESEIIVDLVINLSDEGLLSNSPEILELGIGSGALLISILKNVPKSLGVGIDISKEALEVAQKNLDKMNLAHRATLFHGNWIEGIHKKFDVIVCNPPYISEEEFVNLDNEVRCWEPKIALTPGGDGLSVYRILAPNLHNVLSEGGLAIFEIPPMREKFLSSLFESFGYFSLGCRDHEGIVRSLLLGKKSNDSDNLMKKLSRMVNDPYKMK